MTETRIIYNGFYDAPLAFVASHNDKQYLFWRVFDNALDEFPDEYEVFVLPNLSEREIGESWSTLPEKAKAHVGKINLNQITFDPTRRRSIQTDILEQLSDPNTHGADG
jgi:hypothetical protein